MKRFIIDSILILLIVLIGSSSLEVKPKQIEERIEEFEEKIDHQEIYDHYLPSIDEEMNNATVFAQKSGAFIENVVRISVEFVTSIFQAIVD